MAFADLAKKHATYIAGHAFGEAIAYRAWPATTWASIQGVVQRRPPDLAGEAIENAIEVLVSKGSVPVAVVMRDAIRLTADAQPGHEAPTYLVVEARENAGGWLLRCTKKTHG